MSKQANHFIFSWITSVNLLNLGCTTVPPLSHVTNNGPFGTEIKVVDVVNEVKCELADALDSKIDDDPYKWMQAWTAKADLTLQVNEASGITPNVTFTHPLHNALPPLSSGPGSVLYATGAPGATTTVTEVAQSMSLGVGANYSGQVYRTETVSFALSLKELKEWRERGEGNALRSAKKLISKAGWA